ncbi:MAG TPA: hypothetical protein VFF69_06490 [Phycisphaerales bacterium]|nr:hypothetical protein [Phycisphaerales bacterium]
MSSAAVWAILAFSAIEAAVALAVVRALVRGVWRPLEDAYPARAPAGGAVRKPFQSYRFGILNLGSSVHTTVDAEHLHLEPVRFVRWLGVTPVSVPWDAVRPVRMRGRRCADVDIGGQMITGPRWALELVFAGREGE